MKTLKALTLSLFIGLSTQALAETASTTQPAQAPTTEIKAVEPKAAAAPTAVSQNAVNINTATAAELQDKLIGIGEKKAQAIVDYRTKNGSFKSVEQLSEVSGIGKATLDKNRANIVLE